MSAKPYQVIAWSQMCGGIIGAAILLPIAALQRVAPVGVAYYLPAAGAFLVAAWAGWRLLYKQAFGRELSLAVQLLQVVQLTAAGWMFQYVTGLQVLVKVGARLFQVSPGVNSAVWFGPTLVPVDWQVTVNFFALWASVQLGLRWKEYPSSATEPPRDRDALAASPSGTA